MSLHLISREEARASGLTRYFTGVPCRNGHFAARFTKHGKCSECNGLQNKSRYRTMKAMGLDVHAGSRRFCERNPEKRRESCRKYRERNKDRCALQMAAWERQNKDARRSIWRRGYLLRRDEINVKRRGWSKVNAKKLNAKAKWRKAMKLRATPPWVDRHAISDIYKRCPEGMHVDHVVPLINKDVCGLHVPWNLQYLTAKENLAKGNSLWSA